MLEAPWLSDWILVPHLLSHVTLDKDIFTVSISVCLWGIKAGHKAYLGCLIMDTSLRRCCAWTDLLVARVIWMELCVFSLCSRYSGQERVHMLILVCFDPVAGLRKLDRKMGFLFFSLSSGMNHFPSPGRNTVCLAVGNLQFQQEPKVI